MALALVVVERVVWVLQRLGHDFELDLLVQWQAHLERFAEAYSVVVQGVQMVVCRLLLVRFLSHRDEQS